MKELIDMLTSKLGISGAQAEGGAAVLFKAARDKLGTGEFDQLLGGIPGLADLLRKSAGQRRWPRWVVRRPGRRRRRQCRAHQYHHGRFRQARAHGRDAKRFAPVIMDFLRTRVGPEVASRIEKTLRA